MNTPMHTANAAAGKDERAFDLWRAAEASGCQMDTVILNTLLNVCARSRQVRAGSPPSVLPGPLSLL
jgi:hypothetical protein